jgi:membrane-bound lytic murein transglycosylase D
MLKTTLYKACFILSSFIFMSVASESRTIGHKPVVEAEVPVVNKTGAHHFDSSGLCTCIPFSAGEENAQLPRIKINKNVASFAKKYSKENGYFLNKAKARSIRYFNIIDSVFTELEMPLELKYLAFIESGMKYNAISWVGAVGPWALMPVAAKQYGLKVSRKNDERLDYYKSTKAAAALLTDLYNKYGDWLLVIAAYNSGPAWVDKAIKRSGSRNFWALQQFLPKETQKHIKKYIAVHYHFEGHGSLTTMTKAETAAHIKAVADWVEKHKE